MNLRPQAVETQVPVFLVLLSCESLALRDYHFPQDLTLGTFSWENRDPLGEDYLCVHVHGTSPKSQLHS